MNKLTQKELLRQLENLKDDAINLWEKMDDRYSKEKIDREIENVKQIYQQLKELMQQKQTVTMTEIENAVGDTSDEYTEGVVELFESKGFEVEK